MEVVLHVGKGAKFGVEKVNGGQNVCNRVASVGNRKNFEKQAQCSKGLSSALIEFLACICTSYFFYLYLKYDNHETIERILGFARSY